MSLRDRLKDIENISYNSSINMVTFVRHNYESILKRKEKEIEELKKELMLER
jgi:hypothetical protein